MDGYADVTAETIRLEPGAATPFDLTVPLLSIQAMSRMGEMIRTDPRLQESLPEICGEELRLWEAGLLVGTVRARATEEPVAGARVSVALGDEGLTRSTPSSERGIFVLCNVPVGAEVDVRVELPGAAAETKPVEIRPGMVSWFDPNAPLRR